LRLLHRAASGIRLLHGLKCSSGHSGRLALLAHANPAKRGVVHCPHLKCRGAPARRQRGIAPRPGHARRLRLPFWTMVPNPCARIWLLREEPYLGAKVSTNLFCSIFRTGLHEMVWPRPQATLWLSRRAGRYSLVLPRSDWPSSDGLPPGFAVPCRPTWLSQ
jgi:hypothetical protein